MNKFPKFLIFILILTQSCLTQKFDSELVSKNKELNLSKTNLRGIKCKKNTYYVEKDLQNVTAYKNGKQIWQTNVISNCEQSNVDYYGTPYKISHIKLEKGKLLIVYGKHSYAEIDLRTGKTKSLGSD